MAPNLKRVSGRYSCRMQNLHMRVLDAAKQVAPSAGITVAVVDIQRDALKVRWLRYADQPDSGGNIISAPESDCKP